MRIKNIELKPMDVEEAILQMSCWVMTSLSIPIVKIIQLMFSINEKTETTV